ncbi:FAD-dependent monooxygenase [Pseudolysinimonas yzui]|uniref:FAD-binding domain-containing protein n=1 Tax=Pseudolysinimonas yzui TaxID=2708254 RepID=A0A8J3M3W0_9MICO|nr:FAD-dependent monooxygenase [Pseudolysinimonas yzui]GHF27402.1 hypothetical protein GCM10011600_30300 [Pseudolysinimonas yzui]
MVGGGPGGLFFATLAKRDIPHAQVVLFERNGAGEAFGFGVVFSDRTLEIIDAAHPVLREALADEGVRWDPIRVDLKGESYSFAGNGMSAVHRRVLLGRLQKAARDEGVDLRFHSEVSGLADLADFDVVVAADGANSRLREEVGADALGSTVEVATAKFIWFATHQPFDGLTFLHRRSEHGNFAAHVYPIGGDLSTFIVETDEATWRRAGLDSFDPTTPPGSSDEGARRYLESVFADDLGGHGLIGNNSRWGNFRTRHTASWHVGNVVFLGDSVHTAHFSVGSGTKMAMEDAVGLAAELAATPDDLPNAFRRYAEARRPQVTRIQHAAQSSLSWWEHFEFYYGALDPLDFAFHFFARSIDIERIRRRDPELAAAVEQHWLDRHGSAPLDTPLTVGDATLSGRRLRWDPESATLSDTSGNRVTVDRATELFEAPQDERMATQLTATPGMRVAVVHGGTSVTRSLVAERFRLAAGTVAVSVGDDLNDSGAATLLLSGRADAVARTT